MGTSRMTLLRDRQIGLSGSAGTVREGAPAMNDFMKFVALIAAAYGTYKSAKTTLRLVAELLG